MFKRDPAGHFVEEGAWFWKSYQFFSGKYHTVGKKSKNEYDQIIEQQQTIPVGVMRDDASRKTWWMFMGEFYCEDEDYTATEVAVLVLDRAIKKQRRVKKALAA